MSRSSCIYQLSHFTLYFTYFANNHHHPTYTCVRQKFQFCKYPLVFDRKCLHRVKIAWDAGAEICGFMARKASRPFRDDDAHGPAGSPPARSLLS
jgi:hypothetical protein